MASIKRDGRSKTKPWSVRWREAGKSKERAFATRMQAESFIGDLARGTAVDPKAARQSFREAAERWIAAHPGVESTKDAYRGCLDLHLASFAERPLADVANDRNMAELAVVHHPRGKRMRALLVGTCTKAVNDGILPGHRLAGIKLAKARTSGKRDFIYAAHGQLDQIAGALGSLGLTIWIMRGCGLRIGEVLALESSDFRNGILRVQRQVQCGKIVALKARGAGECRDVPVPHWLSAKVAAHVLANGKGHLFKGSRAEYVGYHTYARAFKTAAKTAGLPAEYSPHQLRHAYATALLGQRVPITDVSRWLGHRNFQVTYETYSHLLPDANESARSALDAEWQAFKAS